jgi:hypothetical protein
MITELHGKYNFTEIQKTNLRELDPIINEDIAFHAGFPKKRKVFPVKKLF